MLYENETVKSRVYDPETGDEVALDQGLVENEELSERIRLSLEIEKMRHSEGWKEISHWLETMETNFKDQLLRAEDLDKVRRLQEAVKVYRSVQNYVAHRILEGKHLQELRDQDPQQRWG